MKLVFNLRLSSNHHSVSFLESFHGAIRVKIRTSNFIESDPRGFISDVIQCSITRNISWIVLCNQSQGSAALEKVNRQILSGSVPAHVGMDHVSFHVAYGGTD